MGILQLYNCVFLNAIIFRNYPKINFMKSIKYLLYILPLLFLIFACVVQKPKQIILKTTTPAPIEQAEIIILKKPILKVGSQEFDNETFAFLWNSFTKIDSIDDSKNIQQFILEQQYVEEALNQKLNLEKTYIDEINGFKENVATSFLADSTTIHFLMKETYEWLKTEVKASHIFIPVPELSEAEDTLKVYNQLIEIKNKINAGESFAEMAKQYSFDRKTAINGGDLGFFSALYGIYPITKTAFSLDINQISNPIRTKTGYHLILVTDKRPTFGEVKIAHIQTKINSNSTEAERLLAKSKIDSAYKLLEVGEKFETVCRLLSDDITSRMKGGVLPNFYGIGKLDSQIEKAAFELKEINDYSKPILSSFGWHIIKLVDKKGLASYESLSDMLREKATTDSRGEIVKNAQILKMKNLSNYKEYSITLNESFTRSDTNIFKKKWNYAIDDVLLQRPICQINDTEIKTLEFFEYIRNSQSFFRIPAASTGTNLFKLYYKKFIESKLKDFSMNYINKENKLYAQIINEYKQNLLKNNLLNKLVYEKSADTLSQRLYFEQNISKYQKPAQTKAFVISSKDEASIQKYNEIISQNGPYRLKKGIQPIYFKYNESALVNEHKKNLLGLLVIMKKNPAFIVEIGGFVDSTERDSVSQARLKNTISFLVENGLSLTRIIENDFQKSKLLKENYKNQKVSFEFLTNAKTDLEKLIYTPENDFKIIEGNFAKGKNPFVDQHFDTIGVFKLKENNKFIQLNIEKTTPAKSKEIKECRGAVYADYQAFLRKQLNEKVGNYPVEMNRPEIEAFLNNQIK